MYIYTSVYTYWHPLYIYIYIHTYKYTYAIYVRIYTHIRTHTRRQAIAEERERWDGGEAPDGMRHQAVYELWYDRQYMCAYAPSDLQHACAHSIDAASHLRDASSTLRDPSTTVRDLSTSVRGAMPAAHIHYAKQQAMAERNPAPVARAVPIPGEVRTSSDPTVRSGERPKPSADHFRGLGDEAGDDRLTIHKPELAPTAYNMPKKSTPTSTPLKVSLPVPDETVLTVPANGHTAPGNSLIPARSSLYPQLGANNTALSPAYLGSGGNSKYNNNHNSYHNQSNHYSSGAAYGDVNSAHSSSHNYGNGVSVSSRYGYTRRFDDNGRYGTLAIPELLQSAGLPMDGSDTYTNSSSKIDAYDALRPYKHDKRKHEQSKIDQPRVWSNPAPIIVESRMVAGGLWGHDSSSPQHYVSVFLSFCAWTSLCFLLLCVMHVRV